MELPTRKVLTLELAKAIADAAKAFAHENGWPIVLAIVDTGGYLVYLERQDGVSVGTVQVAILKAQSAAAFESPSKNFEDAVDAGLIGMVALPGMAPFEGAVPILVGSECIGAIAISGVTKEIDGQVAQVGADAVPHCSMTTRPTDLNRDIIVDFDHHAAAFNLNEVEECAELRARCPVAWNTRHDGFWFVTSYDAVAQIAKDGETFAHKYEPNAPDGVDYYGESGIHGPKGSRHWASARSTGPITASCATRSTRSSPRRRSSTCGRSCNSPSAWFIDQKIADGEIDLVLDLANPVPAIVTMRMMGLPYDDWKLYADLFHSVMSYEASTPEYVQAMAAVPGMMERLHEFAVERHGEPAGRPHQFSRAAGAERRTAHG